MTTPTNSPVRAYTSPELAKIRGDQAASIGLAIEHPTTIYTARVNQDFTTTGYDNVSQITYDGGSGTLANVKEGMTVFIGSAAGLYDRFITRVRKDPTATVLYIGLSSSFLQDNDYISIVDSFGLWARDISSGGGVVMMDYDIVYGDITRGGIIPRLGPMTTVINQISGTITFTPPNPSLSAAYEEGVTISSYTFAAPGASTTSNMTSATAASWTYPLTANQEYRWSCAIVDSLGRTTTAYRRVFVNPTEIPFTLESCGANFDDGDWSFEITNYADVSAIHPRAMVTLYANDYYGGVIGSIGKIAGYENILACGWIDGESIEQDSQKGTVSFVVRGAAQWMDKLRSFPLELTDTNAAETTWNTIQSMTVDRALARLLYWTSTAPVVMDVFLTSLTDRMKILPASSSSLLSQVNSMAEVVFAKALVNSYGQMFINIDPQILDSTDRAALTTVMDITSADYEAPLNIERNLQGKTAMVELGAGIYDGNNSFAVFSRAPGNTPVSFGDISSFDNYFVSTQAECNRIAGALLASDNNPYEPLDINFPANIRLLDIAPAMYCTITTSSASNPRGIALTAQKLIPRSVSYSFDNGILRISASFELATVPTDGIDYFPPTVEDPNLDDGLSDFGDFNIDFPALNTDFGETVPPEVTLPCNRELSNAFSLNFSPRVLTGSTSELISRVYFPCTIRATGGEAGDTRVILYHHSEGDAETNYAMYAVLGGARVLSGVKSGNAWYFSPVSDTIVDGFEIELTAGEGASVTKYIAGKVIETGDYGISPTVWEVGKYYSIEPYTGHWTATFPAQVVGLKFYNVWNTTNSGYTAGIGYSPLGAGDGFGLANGEFLFVERASYAMVWSPGTDTNIFTGKYARGYFKRGTGTLSISASSTGTLGLAYVNMRWALREAQAIGRQITIGGATLLNVCAIA